MAGTIPPNFSSSNDQLIVATIQYFPTIEPNFASISESFIVDVGVWHVEPTRPPFYFPPSHSLPYRLGRGATRITSIDLRSDPHNKHRSAERSAIQASICGAIRNTSINPLPGSRQAAMPESGSGLKRLQPEPATPPVLHQGCSDDRSAALRHLPGRRGKCSTGIMSQICSALLRQAKCSAEGMRDWASHTFLGGAVLVQGGYRPRR